MRKIYIPFKSKQSIGGPRTFMLNLKNGLDARKYNYTKSPILSKGIFFPISTNLRKIKIVKLFGGKVIQRLDGVHYPLVHGDKYVELNHDMKLIYQKYSDYYIFQSEYSRKQVFSMFGEVCNTKYSIIPNGANHSIFFPLEKYKMGEKIRFISTGNFRHSIMILPLVNALESISKKGVELELLLVGPITIPEKVEILNKPFVKNIISSNQIDIADTLRGSDIFVYCLYNTPCPNSVIEAISCGLPVVGFDSGAMSELCFFNSDLLVSMPEKLFHDFLELEGNELQEKIEKCINSFKYYKQKAMEYSGFYSIDKCIERYIKVFDTVCPS